MLNLYTHTQSLADRKVIALADTDNLQISFKQLHGLDLDACALRKRFWARAQKLTAAAVLTSRPGMNSTTDAWQNAGWNVTTIIRETALTCRGAELLANADFDIAFEAGALVTRHHHADTLILMTGDGTLATAIARDVHRRRPEMRVIACAVPGSASARLRDTSVFDSYIELGADVTTAAALCA